MEEITFMFHNDPVLICYVSVSICVEQSIFKSVVLFL